MARRHGSLHAHAIRSLVMMMFALGVIALFGMAHDKAARIISGDRITGKKIIVAATLSPFADAANEIGGDHVEVIPLLLFSSRDENGLSVMPQVNLEALRKADVVLYGGPLVEPAVERLMLGVTDVRAKVVNVSAGAKLLANVSPTARGGIRPIADPAFWLDADDAILMAKNIYQALKAIDGFDPEGQRRRFIEYESAIQKADITASAVLRDCRLKTMIEGGGPYFAYLTHRYQLEYYAMPQDDSGTSVGAYAAIVREKQIPYVFFDLNVGSRSADALANVTDAGTLSLDSGYRLMDHQTDFHLVDLLNENASHLAQGLECAHLSR
jgi:ABC-type Zn uptake system ZnuABC Zn-binding protein ZnuA